MNPIAFVGSAGDYAPQENHISLIFRNSHIVIPYSRQKISKLRKLVVVRSEQRLAPQPWVAMDELCHSAGYCKTLFAKRETSELRRHALKEIRVILNRVDSMKATVDEEMETQRILTNISKIKATSRWMLDDPDASSNEGGSASNGQRQGVASRKSARPKRTASK